MDYKRFLQKPEVVVLPHLGGRTLESHARPLVLDAPIEAGWWRFEVGGKRAKAIERVEEDRGFLERLEPARGHFLRGRVVGAGATSEPLELLPADRPPRFSPVTARRLRTGALLFDQVELEGGVEEEARRAIDEGRSLARVKGVPATLRAAFGYAVAEQVAARVGIDFAHAELRRLVLDIAERDDGPAIAERALRRLAAERLAAEARRAIDRAPLAPPAAAPDPEARAELALGAAGATLLDSRLLAQGMMEVWWRFMGERFASIVRQDGLQVVDAGLCLAGEDALVTLESLPGVVREAIEEGSLVILNRSGRLPLR